MSAPLKAEWKRAHAFSEYAEALGCDTSDVLAAWSTDAGIGAMFTRDSTNPHDEIRCAQFGRDDDGILRLIGSEGIGHTVAQMMRKSGLR